MDFPGKVLRIWLVGCNVVRDHPGLRDQRGKIVAPGNSQRAGLAPGTLKASQDTLRHNKKQISHSDDREGSA
ncbi:hypothetical protein DBV39_17215 [Orrella marina]|uniref:Uncharacterized protein n=1 Tax=Orrella marina TaxID=2163011 RepID=A0A2R4XN00_9BURK|nr:hypothetical protein DBV39_17215 [Orrella marina]